MGPVSCYAPPLAVMALIFALSATPDLSSGLGTWDFILRKTAHVGIFGLLWLTVARASDWRRPSLAAVIGPMVDPHGMSARWAYHWTGVPELSQAATNTWAERASVA